MPRTGTIRSRLLRSFVLMTLLPSMAIAIGAVIVGYQNGSQQAVERLESVAARKELAISSWLRSLQEELIVASNTEGEYQRITVVLTLARDDRYYDFYWRGMRNRLQGFVAQSQLLEDLFLIDLQGRVALSTEPAQDGTDLSEESYFQEGLNAPYAQLPFYSRDNGGRGLAQTIPGVVVAIPILDHDGQPIGVLAAHASVQLFNDLLSEQTGLGATGKAYLLNQDYALLVGSDIPPTSAETNQLPLFIHTDGVEAAIRDKMETSGLYTDHRGINVIGVYRWLPELEAVLAAEQDLSEAFHIIYATMSVILVTSTVALLLSATASLLLSKSISAPLENLVTTATRIASGELDRVAKVDRSDEIGTLALAFNSMTSQLRDLINGLEQRVNERTHALNQANQTLKRRAVQLETSARISREITSILEINDLMVEIVRLIRNAFNYYQVRVYLLDRETGQLTLAASSDETTIQFRQLELDARSINTKAVQENKAQVVNDVIKNPDYLPDWWLPDTRSELVVPLRTGEQIIGTLDVLSTKVDAFVPEDVMVIESLGDQIAIAIENARLYDRSGKLAIIEERTRLARDFHDSVTQLLYSLVLLTEGWRRLDASTAKGESDERAVIAGEIAQQALREMRLLIHELRPPSLDRMGLYEALHHRLDAVEKRAGVEARLLVDNLVELPKDLEEGLYRIAQEALNNVLKHSLASVVTLRIFVQKDLLSLQVKDNGRGFDPRTTQDTGGMGLMNMQERAEQMGGSITVMSTPGQGTTITACVPLNRISQR